MVAGEDDHRVRARFYNKVEILGDGVRGAGVPILALAGLIGLQQAHAAPAAVQIPGLANGNVVIQAVGAILGEDAHGVNAAVDTIAQGKIDDAEFACKGNGRFCPFFGQDREPGPFTTGENHCDRFHKRPSLREWGGG